MRKQENPGRTLAAVAVRDVSMHFRIPIEQPSSLKEYVVNLVKGRNQTRLLKALDHVTLEIPKGEILGIIGTNGSGKSTLLKIIAGALEPTMGEVEADFDSVLLLTLGTGFDRELTARENVYLNGAILGYSRSYIRERYDEIVAFAELEGFMDQKIKNFSSGMVSRLGFAVATARESPGILILDEVLSVGDQFFREKSGKRIQEMINSGATVLIVSHSADTIRKNCTKAVWLEKGVLRLQGDPAEVCRAYGEMGKGGMQGC